MQLTRTLGKTGYQVFPVAYGGIVSTKDGQLPSDRYVAWAIEHGVNYFDVAPSYQDAEEKLGNSLKPYRDHVYLACKTNQRKKKEAEADLVNSLELLHTDHFDTYQLHGLSSLEEVETAFGPGGAMEVLVKAKEEGLTRCLGITCHSEKAALRAMELYDFDSVLFPLNWHMNIGYGMGSEVVKAAKARGMGVLAMKQLIERAWIEGDDAMRARFPKSWCKPIDPENVQLRLAAIRYTLSLGPDILVPPGDFENFSFVVEHIEACLNTPLTDADLALLRENYARVKDHPFFDPQA